LQEFLDARRATFGTLQTIAKHMDVTFSGFLRAVKQGTLSVENCLRLAEVLGEEPAVIFRVANKPDLADQFERLYGKTTNPMTEEERGIVSMWRGLTADARTGFQILLTKIAQAADDDDAASSVQPGLARAVPPLDAQNRPLHEAATALPLAIRELRDVLGEARELTHQLRAATSATLLTAPRRQTAGARAAVPGQRAPARKRGG